MQNLNTTHRPEIRDHDEIYVPVGKARTSFIDVRDIGAVAALALTQPGHANKAYDLTGGEALDYYQVAELFTKELGRPITYKNPSAVGFFIRQLQNKSKLMFALVTTWLYTNTRSRMADRITGAVERLLGRKPITLKQYLKDYREAWVHTPAARQQLAEIAHSMQSRWPDAADLLRAAEDEVLAYITFPAEHWTRLYSTNVLERLNQE